MPARFSIKPCQLDFQSSHASSIFNQAMPARFSIKPCQLDSASLHLAAAVAVYNDKKAPLLKQAWQRSLFVIMHGL
jgi:hypothetical protein